VGSASDAYLNFEELGRGLILLNGFSREAFTE